MPTLADVSALLFTPADDESKLVRALGGPGEGVIADLEDSVPVARRPAARALVVDVFARPRGATLRLVRVNGTDTPFFEADIEALASCDLDGLVLPKATPEALAACGEVGPPVVALIETAAGLRAAYEIASHPRVVALALGAVDLSADLSLEPLPAGDELLYARSQIVVDSRAAGLRRPFDSVQTELYDGAALAREAERARALGFGGKLCIHPSQVECVRQIFRGQLDVGWARRVVEAYEEAVEHGRGAVALDGEMIDLAVAERARSVLRLAEREA
jgi:citrate lyase subunit beta/citryl-CoA lyase